jgi:hypothetical protein
VYVRTLRACSCNGVGVAEQLTSCRYCFPLHEYQNIQVMDVAQLDVLYLDAIIAQASLGRRGKFLVKYCGPGPVMARDGYHSHRARSLCFRASWHGEHLFVRER